MSGPVPDPTLYPATRDALLAAADQRVIAATERVEANLASREHVVAFLKSVVLGMLPVADIALRAGAIAGMGPAGGVIASILDKVEDTIKINVATTGFKVTAQEIADAGEKVAPVVADALVKAGKGSSLATGAAALIRAAAAGLDQVG